MLENPIRKSDAKFHLLPESVAVVMTTLYPSWSPGSIRSIGDTDKVRGDLALKSIQTGVAHGYQVIISDGESSEAFKEELNKYPSIIKVERLGSTRASGRRQCFLLASSIPGIEVILKTEPEKFSIVKEHLPQIVSSIFEGESDVVVARRNPRLFQQTYPTYMWQSEVQGNLEYNSKLHQYSLLPDTKSLDIFFGPIAFLNKPEILKLFLERYVCTLTTHQERGASFDLEDYANSFLFPIVEALYRRYRVSSVDVNFEYPNEQKKNEETIEQGALDAFIEKRREQRVRFISELGYFIKYLTNDSTSGIVKAN